MNDLPTLAYLRSKLGRAWLIALFGIAYVISQITIIIILGPIEDAMINLQTTGTSASDYLAVFKGWQESGEMDIYRAHFILDDVHWIWYAGLFTTLLCWLFDRLEVSNKYNWVLMLPLASGLLDWFENKMQHIFLSTADFSMIVDPLPLISTLASDMKWLFSAIYLPLSIILLARLYLKNKAVLVR